MIDVILHIGRHKTGTSSLQIYLEQNTKTLEEHGYIYPRMLYRGNAHHPLGENLKRSITARLTEKEIKEIAHKYRRKIVRRFLHRGKTLIFSSESFQNCDPKVIRQVFNPERFNVKVICYFRDQVSYYCSAYNQLVHANIFSTDVTDFYNSGGFNGDYMAFADEWSSVFDQLECRVFDRSELHQGDVVTDFCHNILGLETTVLDGSKSNPSLTRKLVAFKLMLNEKLSKNAITIELSDKQIYRRLSQMSTDENSGRYHLPASLAEKIMSKYKTSNLEFSKKYLKSATLKFPKPATSDETAYKLTEDEFSEIHTKLTT